MQIGVCGAGEGGGRDRDGRVSWGGERERGGEGQTETEMWRKRGEERDRETGREWRGERQREREEQIGVCGGGGGRGRQTGREWRGERGRGRNRCVFRGGRQSDWQRVEGRKTVGKGREDRCVLGGGGGEEG